MKKIFFSFVLPTLAVVGLQADQVVTTSVGAGQTVQVADPTRVTTSGTVEVQATGTAYFRSGSVISLRPGFKATANAFFHAAIGQPASMPLAWAAVSGAIRYDIYRNGTKIGDTTGTTFVDTGTSGGGTYTYVIKSIASGGGETVILTVTTTTPSTLEVFTPLRQ